MFVYSLEHVTKQDTQIQVAPGMLYNEERKGTKTVIEIGNITILL